MYGLCYTPFRAFGVCPTDDEVESDVQIMLRHTTRIRIYSTECVNVNKILLKYASKGSLSVLMGVYVDNRATDQQEVDYLIEALKEYPNADLAGIVVGNEVMYRNSLPKSTLIQRINEVREKVRGLGYHTGSQTLLNTPVYAVEIFPDKEINDASDALGLNIHPFYRPDLVDVSDSEEMSEKILQAAIEQIDLYRNMMPTKPIVVTEIGWPTQSDHTEMHRGDLAIALKFMDVSPYRTARFEYLFRNLRSIVKQTEFSTIGLKHSILLGRNPCFQTMDNLCLNSTLVYTKQIVKPRRRSREGVPVAVEHLQLQFRYP